MVLRREHHIPFIELFLSDASAGLSNNWGEKKHSVEYSLATHKLEQCVIPNKKVKCVSHNLSPEVYAYMQPLYELINHRERKL